MSNEYKSPLSTGLSLVLGVAFIGAGWALRSVFAPTKEMMEGKGIPLDPSMTIAVIGVFLILFKVVEFFFIVPLADAINERNRNLEQTFSEAEQLKSDMQKMRTDYEARLTKTEADARDRIQQEVKKAQDLRASITAEAGAKADEMIKKAQDEIGQEKAKALVEIRTHVVDLTLQASAKVVGENMDNARNRKLIEDFIQNLEVTA